jgi:hypothetical protein
MFASMEYLLTGIPVVTTPSRGGRAVFFNHENSIVCEPNPQAVLEAVREWVKRDVAPLSIRNSALGPVMAHRERLSTLFKSIGIKAHLPWKPIVAFAKHKKTAMLLRAK